MPAHVFLRRFRGEEILVARADSRREPIARGDDHEGAGQGGVGDDEG